MRSWLTILLAAMAIPALADEPQTVRWKRLSTITGELPMPNGGDQQTCCLVFDIDGDGVNDFVVGERTQAPSVVWYKYRGNRWDRFVVDDTRLRPEAGGAAHDVDGDGDLDIILGQDSSGPEMWWWENPAPAFDKPWTRRRIKDSGGRKHHDQTTGDFDGDGRAELVSWNQGAKSLLSLAIPADPRHHGPWPATTIYRWSAGQEHEGFPTTTVDVDGDGTIDLVGGGRWFKHRGEGRYEAHLIDDALRFTQCAAGQLVPGGRPEIVFSPGDADGEARWYEWTAGEWKPRSLRHVIHGHTCEVGDVNADGALDIMIGEMGDPGAGDDARIFVWYGDRQGRFTEAVVSHGQGIHEGKLADLDGDGDLDILLKPYHHHAPRIDVLLNEGP